MKHTRLFVLFKVEGEQYHVEARVRDLIRQWSSEHRGKELELLLKCSAEILPLGMPQEMIDDVFKSARMLREGTITELVSQTKPLLPRQKKTVDEA